MHRFYFLGDDDLLEILGQPSNPEVIQCHLNKLFAGIHSVSLNSMAQDEKGGAKNTRDTGQLVAMVSVDGEEVPFPSTVAVTTVVEEWLATVCSGMRHALQVLLPAALRDAGGGQAGMEPGSSEWAALPAQVLSLMQEISFSQVGYLKFAFHTPCAAVSTYYNLGHIHLPRVTSEIIPLCLSLIHI